MLGEPHVSSGPEERPVRLSAPPDRTGRQSKKLKTPRTISAREALTRVEHLLPGLTAPRDRLDQLINVRDGVVHVGYLQDKETQEILTAMLRFSKELYEALALPARDRWGVHADLVASLITDSLTEIEREVHRKLVTSRLRIDELLTKIPEEEHISVMAARQAQGVVIIHESEEQIEATCPVCDDEYATCVGEPEILWEADIDIGDEREAYVSGTYGIKILHARNFVCGACELSLFGADELKAAGFETRIELDEEVDPADYSAQTEF